MATKNMPIKQRLSELLNDVKVVKNNLQDLKRIQKQFTFNSLLSKAKQQQRQKVKNQQSLQNKENISINTNRNVVSCPTKQEKQKMIDKKERRQSKAKQSFQNQFTQELEDISMSKNKKDQMRNLKAGLMMQLSQIKSMEKKSQSMRRVNEKIKQFCSNRKRQYRESQSKQKQYSNTSLHDISEICQKSTPLLLLKQVDSLIIDSKISLARPIIPKSIQQQQQQETKILKCAKGHQFYEGYVNNCNLPHGNGRLDVCCSHISNQIGGPTLKDSLFYQGLFKNGKFHGFGTLSYRGGVKYVGQFREGKRHGKGSMYCNGKAEVANWQNDVFISIM